MVHGSIERVIYKQIKAGDNIKNLRRLLTKNENKTNLTDYVMESWKEKHRETLGDVLLMISSREQCYLMTKERVTEIAQLRSTRA